MPSMRYSVFSIFCILLSKLLIITKNAAGTLLNVYTYTRSLEFLTFEVPFMCVCAGRGVAWELFHSVSSTLTHKCHFGHKIKRDSGQVAIF